MTTPRETARRLFIPMNPKRHIFTMALQRHLHASSRARRHHCRGRGVRRGGCRCRARRRSRRGSRRLAWWRARRGDSAGIVAMVVVIALTSACHDDSSAPTTRWTARGERAGGWRRSPRSRIRSPRRTTATPRRCARDRFPATHRARDPDARPRDARFAAALIHLYAARRRSPPTFPSPPPRRLADSGRGGERRGRRDSSTHPRA